MGRADRDEHVHFFSVNVIQPFLHNFDKQSLENTTFTYDYDYNSIMHYGANFFRSSSYYSSYVILYLAILAWGRTDRLWYRNAGEWPLVNAKVSVEPIATKSINCTTVSIDRPTISSNTSPSATSSVFKI